MSNLEVALHEVATITMGTSPKGTTYNHESLGLPLLNGPTEFGEVHPHCTLYTTDSKKECKTGDLIFCVRASAGRMNWADQLYSLGRGVCSIRGETPLGTKYIRYCIEWKLNSLLNLAGGSTYPNLTKDMIRDFPIPYLKSRHKIAAVLSAYDDLIENNTRRIKILEEMASAIYREWFVEFRFPGHEQVPMVESELGLIPQGWEVVVASEAISINPRVSVPRHTEKPFVPMKSAIEHSMLITEVEQRTGNSGAKFKNHDTLFARITPCLENGRTGFVQFLPSDDMIALGSTEFIVLRSKTLNPYFVYLLAQTHDFKDNAVKSMTGATGRQRVVNQCFDNYFLPNPDQDSLRQFECIIAPLFKKVQNLWEKNTNLRQTRDLLLPKLISGEIDISELDIDTD